MVFLTPGTKKDTVYRVKPNYSIAGYEGVIEIVI